MPWCAISQFSAPVPPVIRNTGAVGCHRWGGVRKKALLAWKTGRAAWSKDPSAAMEAGYPSSTTCGSAEAQQADFIGKVFEAWDSHADKIQAVNFNWLTDISLMTLTAYEQYYSISDPRFLAFLASLGYRNNAGAEKQSFGRLKQEAAARGWTPRSEI